MDTSHERGARRWSGLFGILTSLVLISGCATSAPPAGWSQEQAAHLRTALLELGPHVDNEEASRLATQAVDYPIFLSQEYRLVRPAWVHNHLVNAGRRKRGLCYHWANDLFVHLHELAPRSLQLHLAVARMDTRREHNAVVVTAHGQPFAEGIVLDGWRHSGRLWWGRVERDKYPWQPLPYERVNPALQKFVTR